MDITAIIVDAVPEQEAAEAQMIQFLACCACFVFPHAVCVHLSCVL